MHTIFKKKIIAIGLLAITLSCCKDEEVKKNGPTSNSGSLTMEFTHEVDGSPLSKAASNYYTNAAGNLFIVSTLNYYISNIELTKVDDTKVKFNIYKLIDGLSPSTESIVLNDIPNGDYKAISYYIGIDSVRNHSGAQDGDLSPTKGMMWTWSSGYLFLKMEGFYKKNDVNESFRYHIGTDGFLNKITNSINFTIQDGNKKAKVLCNVAEFFKNPNTWDISLKDDLQSFPTELTLTAQLAANMKDMITVTKIE